MTRYRPEIDGMRALAVLAVVLFHAGVPGFSAGFVGVDAFLVISGYLIGGLILGECDAGQFSLIGFYERRVRRILPALLVMLDASALAALILLPADFRAFGVSLAAISAFLSNFLFARANGYFGIEESTTPLLHTWSLAVEEQFYLAFPLLLLLARRKGKWGVRILLVASAILSFGYSVLETRVSSGLAFYSPLSRAWEFLAGAVLATGWIPLPRRREIGDAAALLGLGLGAASLLWLQPGMPFPGIQALPIVMGSVLLLWGMAAAGSWIARALRVGPLVGVGLISYSLYLWHWPLIVFGSYYVLGPVGPTRLAMALLAFPMAWLSWRFVELPFRRPRLLLSRGALFIGAGAASAILVLYGAIVYRANGFPNRFDRIAQRLAERGPEPDYDCTGRSIAEMRRDLPCRIGGAGPNPSFVLWGDSHAAVYFPALDALARRYGVSGYDATRLACPPLGPIRTRFNLPGRLVSRAAKRTACGAHNREVMQFLIETRPHAVILAAAWTAHTDGRHALVQTPDDGGLPVDASLAKLRALGIRVYVVLDVPMAPLAEPRALAKAYLRGATAVLEPGRAAHLQHDAGFRAMATSLQRRGLIDVIDPALRLCDGQSCRVIAGGYPVYYNTDHLGAHGAVFVAPLFEPMMRFLAASQRPGDRIPALSSAPNFP